MRLEELGKLRKSNDLIGNRIPNLPTCSIVPQPTTLTLVPSFFTYCSVVHIFTCGECF
jgi:hypothetical protein